MENEKIWLYNNNLVKNEINNIEKANILKEDKELILKFGEHCKISQLSDVRIRKYLWTLKTIATKISNLNNITSDKLNLLLLWLEEHGYSEGTKIDYRVTLSVFIKWCEAKKQNISVEELKAQGKLPKILYQLKTKNNESKQKLPEDLLTEDEVQKLIKNASGSRNKAIISILYESGVRIGELGSLRIKDLQFTDYGVSINVNGKTGQRRILLITSTPYLKNWLNEHPKKDNPREPLWIGEQSQKEIKYSMFRKLINQAFQKAGIKKPNNPHQFRHSRATYMAQSLTEQQLKEYFGWKQSSDMAAKYVHLSGKQIDDAVLKMHGIKKNEQETSNYLPKKCMCGELNEPTILFCKKCQAPLTSDAYILRKEEEKIYRENTEKEYQIKMKEMETKMNIMFDLMQTLKNTQKSGQ